jgi:hypothetical protein
LARRCRGGLSFYSSNVTAKSYSHTMTDDEIKIALERQPKGFVQGVRRNSNQWERTSPEFHYFKLSVKKA